MPNWNNTIASFSDEYSFLSNFYSSTIYWDGEWWPTVEHAYQAAKTNDQEDYQMIRDAATPGQAKRLGRKVAIREDWDEIKFQVMQDLLRIKFENPYLREKLLETGTALLVEGNTWHDNIWGNCGCLKCTGTVGKNALGLILMTVREEIKHHINQS